MLTIIFQGLCVLFFLSIVGTLVTFIVATYRSWAREFTLVFISLLLLWLIFGCYTLAITYPSLQ